jgi:hypothetical protein
MLDCNACSVVVTSWIAKAGDFLEMAAFVSMPHRRLRAVPLATTVTLHSFSILHSLKCPLPAPRETGPTFEIARRVSAHRPGPGPTAKGHISCPKPHVRHCRSARLARLGRERPHRHPLPDGRDAHQVPTLGIERRCRCHASRGEPQAIPRQGRRLHAASVGPTQLRLVQPLSVTRTFVSLVKAGLTSQAELGC